MPHHDFGFVLCYSLVAVAKEVKVVEYLLTPPPPQYTEAAIPLTPHLPLVCWKQLFLPPPFPLEEMLNAAL